VIPLAELPAERLHPVRALVLDVDGVLTDGGIVYGHAEDAGAFEILRFHVRDGAALKLWQRAGHAAALLSGRGSPMVERRAAELGIRALRLRAKEKGPALDSLLQELGSPAPACCYVGDDLADLPAMRAAGLAVAVADAAEDVRRAADAVTRAPGGAGAVRELVETLLRAQGRWETVLAPFGIDPARETLP
jgi:3-deoxy-D-manno-octulosonate 8-phosphate phosphatase (KDO 8-P phosphatase)